jgi:hypothetical protein
MLRSRSITKTDIRAFTVNRLAAGAAPAEINRELAVLKRMFTLAVKGTRLMVRPHVPMLQENNVRTGFFAHDLRRTAVRNLERAGMSRGVAMQLTGHQTESVYRRYAIVSESDLGAGLDKLHALGTGAVSGTVGKRGRLKRFRRSP